MKRSLQISIVLMAGLGLLGCNGKFQQRPVDDLPELRENAKKEVTKGPEKPQVIEHYNQVPVVETPKKPVIDSKFLMIDPDRKMTFIEGQTKSFSIHAWALIPNVKIGLKIDGLPKEAVLNYAPTKEDDRLYQLTWTAPMGFTAPESAKTLTAKVTIFVTEVPKDQDQKIKTLTREQEITVVVAQAQAVPSDVKIINLSGTLNEGSITPFQVEAIIPGVDSKSAQKPSLIVSYDKKKLTPGNNFQELDGQRYVNLDSAHAEPEYIGDFKWRFYRTFDTQNISVQPQIDAKGKVLAAADGLRVRLSFQVKSPYNGTLSADVLKQIKISYNKPLAAPHFDFIGLEKGILELTPGQKMNFKFYVESLSNGASVKIEIPDLKNLLGAPTIECTVAKDKSSRQNCILKWNVPCSAQDQELSQQIKMTAQSMVEGKNSDPVEQILKTQRSKAAKIACQGPKTPKTPVNPKAPVEQTKKESKK